MPTDLVAVIRTLPRVEPHPHPLGPASPQATVGLAAAAATAPVARGRPATQAVAS